MITEHALLSVIPGREDEFEAALAEARQYIEASPGFGSLRLERGIESPSTYLLLVEWGSVDAHEIGFRGSSGYLRWKALLHPFYDPFPVVEHFTSPAIQKSRRGSRPEVSTDGPHRQLTQRSSPALWGRMVEAAFDIPGVVEGHSAVSPASSRALIIPGALTVPQTSLAAIDDPIEPVHLHGVDDTSIHLCLSAERGAELDRLGWAEPHQYADHGSEVMIYGPRDEAELQFVLGVIAESVRWAQHENP